MAELIIGVDPHKRSTTIEVIDAGEKVLARARFGTDSDGYKAMLAAGRHYRPDEHRRRVVTDDRTRSTLTSVVCMTAPRRRTGSHVPTGSQRRLSRMLGRADRVARK